MSLLPDWSGQVTLPPIPRRRLTIGGNAVVQAVFPGSTTRGLRYASTVPGHDLLRTDLSSPFNELLIRRSGARRRETDLPVVTSSIDETTGIMSLAWDESEPLKAHAATPEDVLKNWVGKFDFKTEDPEFDLEGLRPPQTGALHAISAHFSVGGTFDPATVVLPTGTGKTETMLATQVFRRLTRTMVLVPSDALRSQIARKFESLGELPRLGIVPVDIARPRVAILTTGVGTVEEVEQILRNANVIITLPQTLEASDPTAKAALIAGCSDLMVDEAHHVTASTWSSIKIGFDKKRVVQFTATPFRRDKARIDGKIIFNFKLGDAQAAGYYKPINLVTIEEYGDQETRDRRIAREALAALRRDREELGLDHLLMARARTKERAEDLIKIYAELAPEYDAVVVYSGAGTARANRDALARLVDRGDDGARIVVAVNMLGEGYDLPNLKVAALHDTHKSLAITLQFVGRFTRKGNPGQIGDATVVANIADPEMERKLSALYAEGADWDTIIRRLSEDRINQEVRLQDVVDELRGAGDLHMRFALWNLRPSLSTQFFRTSCDEWNPQRYAEVLGKDAETWHALDEKQNVLVAVVRRLATIGWGNYQDDVDVLHDLVIIRWDKEAGVLCLYASDYSAMRSERMATVITDERTVPVSGRPIFRILNNVELPLAKSLGSSRIGAISFTSYFGPNVTEGLAMIEKRESELNNIACLGYENGERVLWGAAQRRGKVWQQRSGNVAEWIDWTRATWAKVQQQNGDESNIVEDFLRPEKIDAPWSSPPIAAMWGEQAQLRLNDRQAVTFDGAEVPLYLVDLAIDEPEADGAIPIHIQSGVLDAVYRLRIDAKLPKGYDHEHVSGPEVRFRKGNDAAIALEEYLQKDPFLIRYVDGTYSYNCYHIPVRLDAGQFDKSRLETWDWGGIPLNRESAGKQIDRSTIQYRTFEQIEAEFDVVFNDDGSGEAADLVCLKDVDEETIRLCLVHCKNAHGGAVTQDIRNFYTVCGQAQKSIVAKHQGLPRLYLDLKRRHEIWAQEGYTRFLKGGMKELSYFKEKARRARLRFEMMLVQPGASASNINNDALLLLGTTELYLKKTTEADLRVVVSP